MMRDCLFFFLSLSFFYTQAQVFTFQSTQNQKTITHRVLMDSSYLIETQYVSEPAEFLLTRGGFYSKKGNKIEVNFEFNSNFSQDGLKKMDFQKSKQWKTLSTEPKELNGKWLMAGRMTPEGERRRDTSGPRKTMKFLIDGFFQWTAFNTETFQFFGSGGGYYTAEKGKYTEHLEYFSRDNKRVGAILPFDYDLKESDWHHKGFSSKGDPMHEIWAKRIQE